MRSVKFKTKLQICNGRPLLITLSYVCSHCTF